MTFKWKNSILITIVISIILMVVNILFNVTFHSWTQEQQQNILQREIDQFKLKLTDPSIYGTYIKPHLGMNTFPIQIEQWREDLEEGQSLRVKDKTGMVIIKVDDKFPSDKGKNSNGDVKLLSVHEHITIPQFGDCIVSIDSIPDSGGDSIIEMNEILLTTATILGIILTSFSTYFISKMTIRPISNIIKRVQSIDAHNLKEHLDLPKTKDEIYELTKTFNDLLVNLENSFEQQRWFIADASHELKTPIAVIEGHTNMLKRWGKESPEILDESIEFISQETRSMQTLVNQLLLLASIESERQDEKLDRINFVQLISDISDSIKTLKPSVSVQVSANPNSIFLHSNRFFIEHILMNLLDNAVKYTQPGGAITVHALEDQYDISLTVKDTGIGIPEEDLPNIFNRFYRVDKSRSRKQGGTGLGLAITKNLIDKIGGTIKIESEVMKGTTVYVTIPKR